MADLLKQIKVEVIVSKFALIGPTEACLESEGVGDIELLPADDASCRLFGFLYDKGTVSEVEYIAVLVHEAGEDALLQPVIDSPRISIHEDILLTGVTMQITD